MGLKWIVSAVYILTIMRGYLSLALPVCKILTSCFRSLSTVKAGGVMTSKQIGRIESSKCVLNDYPNKDVGTQEGSHCAARREDVKK